jgi:hypothetical protein
MERLSQEEEVMKKELEMYGTVFRPPVSKEALQLSDIKIPYGFNPTDDRLNRPAGWNELKARRVAAKAKAAGSDPNTSQQIRSKRDLDEDDLMLKEVLNYIPFQRQQGQPFDLDTYPVLQPSNLSLTKDSFDPNGTKRPTGWEQLRARRVHAKERAAGVDTSSLLSIHPIREREVRERYISLTLNILSSNYNIVYNVE